MTDEKKLEKIIGGITRLPSLPNNIQNINRMIDSHNSTLEAIGRAIAADQTLSAQVLRLVNSGFYGLSKSVSSVHQAVILLGLNVIRSLISTAWASNMIAKSFPGLHDHCKACSKACYILSKRLLIDVPEEISTLGLLHDIGKVVLAEHLPDEFAKVQTAMNAPGVRFCEAERAMLGFDHSDIARWLLKKWNLPSTVIGPIADHHHFRPSATHAHRTAILILADVAVHAEGFGWSGDNLMPDLAPGVTDLLKLQPGDLRGLMDEIVDQLHDIPRYQGDAP